MRRSIAFTLSACALGLCLAGDEVRADAPVAELAYPVDGGQSRAWVVAANLDGANLRRLLPRLVHGWGELRWSSDGARLAAAPYTGSRSPSIKVACAWNLVPNPRPAKHNLLAAGAAISARDVWAVGISWDGANDTHPLIEHWDGSQWTVAPSSGTPGREAFLADVSAISPSDVWAVGWSGDHRRTLTEHWDGNSWTVVPSPNRAYFNALYSVAAVSSSDVWAVGDSGDPERSLVEHWDGKRWRIVATPNALSLSGVEAISAEDAWVVGGGDQYQPTVLRWNGKRWKAGPNLKGSVDFGLKDVAATSSSDVWAVGWSRQHGILAHWNGTAWTRKRGGGALVTSVTARSTTDAWAISLRSDPKLVTTDVVLHWNGKAWTSAFRNRNKDADLEDVVAVSASDVWALGHYTEHMTCS